MKTCSVRGRTREKERERGEKERQREEQEETKRCLEYARLTKFEHACGTSRRRATSYVRKTRERDRDKPYRFDERERAHATERERREGGRESGRERPAIYCTCVNVESLSKR